jgi:hypothetical protein
VASGALQSLFIAERITLKDVQNRMAQLSACHDLSLRHGDICRNTHF